MNILIAGRIIELGILLNRMAGIEVQVLYHGHTGCLCVLVSEDKTQIYENRAFTTNERELMGIKEDMIKMKEYAKKERRAGK